MRSYPVIPVCFILLSCLAPAVDSDGDGLPDEFELAHTTPPSATALNPGDDLELDGAGDGLTNLEEFQLGTDPLDEDTDGDTLFDGNETIGTDFVPATDPLDPDTDDDGLGDEVETNTGIFVSLINTGTSPIFFDTDEDGFDDRTEIESGTNPTDSRSAPLELLRYWRFDGSFADEEQGETGTSSGSPGYAADRFGNTGKALEVSGDDFVLFENGSALNGLEIGSISVWVKWSGSQDGGLGGSFGAVLGRQQDGVASNQIISLNGPDPATAVVIWKPHGAGLNDVELIGTTPVGDGTWRHLVITYRNGLHRLYVDGQLEATNFFPFGEIANDESGAMPMTVGAWGGSFASALIDDLRIYRGTLTAGQVGDLFIDADADGMSDAFEIAHSAGGSSTTLLPDADEDGDGLLNLEEFQNGSDPNNEDSDSDGFLDGREVAFASDPSELNSVPARSIARVWNEEILSAIRLAFPDPPVHARNLFHLSAAMWDAWAGYDEVAVGYLHREEAGAVNLESAREEAISYAAYRVLSARYTTSPHPLTPSVNVPVTKASLDAMMRHLGYDISLTSTVGNSPEAVGNRVAETILAWGLNDGANEVGGYRDPTYSPVNSPLDLRFAGTNLVNPSRWQPLEFVTQISQNGLVLDSTVQEFVGSHWGRVIPFSLSRADEQQVYLDPGRPPLLGDSESSEAFKEGNVSVIRYSSLLDPDAKLMMDISPGATGNNPLGTNGGNGHSMNPVTGEPYQANIVNQADFGRVVAEYWADGPQSETPPGHWNRIANEVAEHPAFERRFEGPGPLVDSLEWDVKMYFLLNAAVHDAAVAAWDCKRTYDYIRPISSIRHMGGLGQSTDQSRASYHPDGLPLVENLIEEVTIESSASGERHEHLVNHLGEIAIYAWGGEPLNPQTQYTGAKWIRAVEWLPYQRDTFVTPAFAGYVSGHSCFSRAAAEILTKLTGSAFFPGGMGSHLEPEGSLKFEFGPGADVELQWATYFDAADQAGESRLYGGIHVPVDDGPGRIMGSQCGLRAWSLGTKYFDGRILTDAIDLRLTREGGEVHLAWNQYRGLRYEVETSDLLDEFEILVPFRRATSDQGGETIVPSLPGRFYRVRVGQ